MALKGDLLGVSFKAGGSELADSFPRQIAADPWKPSKALESSTMENELASRGFPQTNLLGLLIPLARRKRFIALLAGGCGLCAAIVSLLLPVRFTATTTILPRRPSVQYGTSTRSSLFSSVTGNVFDPNDMYAEMMRSQAVEDALIQQFNLKDRYRVNSDSEARKALEENCNIENAQSDGGLIRVSITDTSPQLAAEMTNAYVRNFNQLNADIAGSGAHKRRIFLESQIAAIKENLLGAEEALRKAQIANGLVQVNTQMRALIESSAMIRAQITAKRIQIQGIRSFASNDSPELKEAERELSAWQDQLTKSEDNSPVEDGMQISRLRAPAAILEYERRLRDVGYFVAVLQSVEPEYESAKLDEVRQGSPVAVVEQAVPPDRRSYPKRTMIVLIASAAGMMLGVFGALLEASIEDESPSAVKNVRRLLASFGIVHPHPDPSATS
jgi:tyrosine-protein kinase Etk/Wzc